MLDLKFIRENPDVVRTSLEHRKMEASLDELLEADRKWRAVLGEVESLRSHQNTVSKEISQLKKAKVDASEQITEMRKVSQKIKTLNEQAQRYKSKVDEIVMTIPNLPHASTPIGESAEDNPEIKRWGEIPSFDFEPK
ncbi:MAG: serine--tRNA ligase, partial [Candidatus Poribacteria bacterium]